MALDALLALRRALARTAVEAEDPEQAAFNERVVTAVGVAAAVLVVCLIAVLMGMVGP